MFGRKRKTKAAGVSRCACLATFVVAGAFGISSSARCQTYRLIELGPGDSGDTSSAGSGINNLGQVVGFTYTLGSPGSGTYASEHAALWNGPTPTIIGSSNSQAFGINNHGQVVGTEGVWNGTWTGIGDGLGLAINDAGTVAGQANFPACFGAAVWIGTTVTQLSPCPAMGNSWANSINNAGQVVGRVLQALADHLLVQATLWNGTTPTVLESLGGTDSTAYWINNAGQVVGASHLADGTEHAVEWNLAGISTDLGTLGGSTARALGINDAGQVVGVATTPGDNASLAVVWVDGKITDLHSLLDPSTPNFANIKLLGAAAINDEGWIVANGTDGAQATAFLLEPEMQPGNPGGGGGALDLWSFVFLCSLLGLRGLSIWAKSET